MRRRMRWGIVPLGVVTTALLLVVPACTSDLSGSSGSNGGVGKATSNKVVDPADYSSTQSAFRIANTAWTGGISDNPYSPSPTPFLNLSLLNLGAYSNTLRPGPNPYVPELAEGWTVGDHQITFNLRQEAKWQDGSPFTTKDVIDSFLLAGFVIMASRI